jgi:hypothetical protein
MNNTSFVLTAANGWSTHPLEENDGSPSMNEAGTVPEASLQVDPMCAWDWCI